MIRDLQILGSRRAYEFAMDDIRLTMLSNAIVLNAIRKRFFFEAAVVGTPMATFGPVDATIPPGLVFNSGLSTTSENTGTPIRLLHIERTRIVIDIAGTSDEIAPVFEKLMEMVGQIRTDEGFPAVGKPFRHLDQSDVRGEIDFSFDRLLHPAIRDSVLRYGNQEGQVAVPFIATRMMTPEGLYPGLVLDAPELFRLELRAGTQVSHGSLFSSAPLPSDAHIDMLNDLVTKLEA